MLYIESGIYMSTKKYFVSNGTNLYNLLILHNEFHGKHFEDEIDNIKTYLKLILDRINETKSIFVINEDINESPIKYSYEPGLKCFMYANYYGNNFECLKNVIEKFGYKMKEKEELTKEEKATFGIYE